MTTVLVTGGLGFIGSHFVQAALERRPDWRVVNLDKITYAGHPCNLEGVESSGRYVFIRGDIADAAVVGEVFARWRPEAVVNFAAETHVDRSILSTAPFVQTNIVGVQVLADAARAGGVRRFVQVSTDEVYGDLEGRPAAGEDAPLQPGSPYAASKAAADLLVLAYLRTYGLPVIIARSSNNYGPRQFPEKLIPLVIRNAHGGLPVPVYGDGAQVRDWLWVGDNVEALLRVLERGRTGAVYNIATGEERDNLAVVRQLCSIIADETGVPSAALLERITFVADRPGHDRRYAMTARVAREELAWRPMVSFPQGLRETVRWYLANADWVERVTAGDYRRYYQAVYEREWETKAPS